jgi:hypothetical protein
MIMHAPTIKLQFSFGANVNCITDVTYMSAYYLRLMCVGRAVGRYRRVFYAVTGIVELSSCQVCQYLPPTDAVCVRCASEVPAAVHSYQQNAVTGEWVGVIPREAVSIFALQTIV